MKKKEVCCLVRAQLVYSILPPPMHIFSEGLAFSLRSVQRLTSSASNQAILRINDHSSTNSKVLLDAIKERATVTILNLNLSTSKPYIICTAGHLLLAVSTNN